MVPDRRAYYCSEALQYACCSRPDSGPLQDCDSGELCKEWWHTLKGQNAPLCSRISTPSSHIPAGKRHGTFNLHMLMETSTAFLWELPNSFTHLWAVTRHAAGVPWRRRTHAPH